MKKAAEEVSVSYGLSYDLEGAGLTKGSVESGYRETFSWIVDRVRSVGASSIVHGRQSHAESDPEGTKGSKDDEGEGVADYPLHGVSNAHGKVPSV